MQDILTTKIYTLIRKITSPPISEKKTYYILVAALQCDANKPERFESLFALYTPTTPLA